MALRSSPNRGLQVTPRSHPTPAAAGAVRGCFDLSGRRNGELPRHRLVVST